ncbi:beta barrel domain-containing protein [Streptomyces griseofuscus]|uniref:beta barrel domain-containing protein n=1 Tax=Streptomyces griseofuscus TaxID=146922 RepID=UPI0036B0244A
MSGLPAVKVGDPLILVTGDRYRGDEPVTVSRVGRTYLYVATLDGRERRERYDRKTGVEDVQRGVQAHLLTQEQYDDRAQRATLFNQLYDAGIEVRMRGGLTTDQLRALLAVVKPAT